MTRKNIRFIGVVLVLFVLLINLSGRSSKAKDQILSASSLPMKLPPNESTSYLSSSLIEDINNTTVSEAKIKEKIISERIKSGYEKYDKNTTQGALVESFSNEGYAPKACLLMFLSSPTGDRIDPQVVYKTIVNVQKRFNDWFSYPWVFISADGQEYENPEFLAQIKNLLPIEHKIEFNTANSDYFWGVPDWVDVNKVADSQIRLSGLEYGDSQFYRFMSRYFVGFFWKEEFLQDYDWYWRIEPGLELLCDIKHDLFRWMQDRNQVFGFSLSYAEPHKEVVNNLWKLLLEFVKDHESTKDMINFKENGYEFVTKYTDVPDDVTDADKRLEKEREAAKKGGPIDYNGCQYESSFQLANLNFFRSEPFKLLFDKLDKNGGFFIDRWSSSSVQTMAINLFLRKNQIYFFDNIGFSMSSDSLSTSSYVSSMSRNFYNCPIDDEVYREFNCECDQGLDFTFMKNSCTVRFYDMTTRKKPDDWNKH